MNKSPFTDEELEELRATLYAVSMMPGCGSAPLYNGRKAFAKAYNNVQVKAMELSEEEEERQAEVEAIRLLEGKGYKVTR